ncbi:hypothetical protein H6F76_19010 [Leptolyngbya sp. FACHB-321]|uniref:hypothetical protein n=1 Tax=Leptolyngbya sp. FACHB-321 TaxID=2692807 RepID=UPI0016859449|nr:hypothetical protein [Leptolyngbya sp. FACHB-321]MBD2037062.1 hypothetical protein [Leptolyngbya sp. FACHB-321]
MSIDSEQQSNVAMIHQSINELHQLLSDLEVQSKLGLLIEPLKLETIEVVAPEAQLPILDDGYFRVDELNGFRACD